MKQLTVSIIGVGARGGETYGAYMHRSPDRFRIAALCDPSASRLKKYGELFGVPQDRRFCSEENFFAERRSDLLVVAALDRDHVRLARKGIALGYHILLEKPISYETGELISLSQAAQNSGSVVMVCHVLRYTPAMRKLGELLAAGEIGKLLSVDDLEQVAYWHFAHSYVRGNWRRAEETAPAILAKCCHDLDLLQFFAGAPCKRLASMGRLSYFTPENGPENRARRCTACTAREACPYDAEKVYLEAWKRDGRPQGWPYTVLSDRELNEGVLLEAIETGPYGACVFNGENDVADQQTVLAEFENGVFATLRMMAFTAGGGRQMKFFGSCGEMEYDEAGDRIVLKRFGREPVCIRISELAQDLGGHGGGDTRMVDCLYRKLTGEDEDCDTSLVRSIESHLMAIAAERSRLSGGTSVPVHVCESR